jgi:hypothetical protein
MNALGPTRTLDISGVGKATHLPMGAPIPFDRQSDIVSKGAASSVKLQVSKMWWFSDVHLLQSLLACNPALGTFCSSNVPNPGTVAVQRDVVLDELLLDLDDFVLGEDHAGQRVLETNETRRCGVNVVAKSEVGQDIVLKGQVTT